MNRPHARPVSRIVPLVLPAVLLLLLAAPAFAQDAQEEEEAPPRLAEIVIEGNERTSETLIRREMGLVEGQVFTYDDLDRVWDHLEDIGYFAFVDMEYDDSDPDRVVLRVLVEEDITLHYGPLLRYDRRHKYRLGAQLEERNLGGRGQKLSARLVFLYLQRASVSWEAPWLFGVEGLRLRVDADAEQADFVFRPTRYREANAGVEVRWRFEEPFYALASATYGTFRQRDSYDFAAPDRGDGPGPVVTRPAGTSDHVVVRSAMGLDTRDNPYYPSRGFTLEGGFGHWTSDDFDEYLETRLDASVFVPLPIADHVLAAHGWGRTTDGPVQLDNRLWFGGPETIRGHPFGQREGEEGWLASVEYRAPLFIMPISPRGELIGAGLHAFFDAGDAWYHGAEPGRPLQSWGAGAHLNLDTLQLRFEAARTDDGRWVFEFMDKFNF